MRVVVLFPPCIPLRQTRLHHCLQIAERMYNTGNATVEKAESDTLFVLVGKLSSVNLLHDFIYDGI